MVRSSSSHLCWWKQVEAGGSGWNLVQYVSVAYQNLSIESRIRFNVMPVAQKGRGMICQIVPNPNKYSMAFQISRADLVNKQITAPHNKTSLSMFIMFHPQLKLWCSRSVGTSHFGGDRSHSIFSPHPRGSHHLVMAWRWCCEVHADPSSSRVPIAVQYP